MMVRGRQCALMGQGRLGLGREVAPSQHPSACGAQRGTTAPPATETVPKWHQINNTQGTNPSFPQPGWQPKAQGAALGSRMNTWMPSALPKGHRTPKKFQPAGHRERIQGQGELQVLLLLHLQHGEARAASVLQDFGVFSTCKCAAGNGHRHFGHSPALLALLGSWAWTRVMGTERN